MSAMTIDLAPTDPRSQIGERSWNGESNQNGRSTGTRPLARPGRGSARGRAPQARPSRAVPAPSIQASPAPEIRGCVAEHAVAAAHPTTWQLTDRGIAVVLVSILMIVVAAVAVIGLTAFRVTGDSFQGYGQSTQSQWAQP